MIMTVPMIIFPYMQCPLTSIYTHNSHIGTYNNSNMCIVYIMYNSVIIITYLT